ncbi:MAG TPA: hypothetical protein VL943_12565 [Niabella sp.]|nr:hypothetical protein [Niabella sp.]
MRVIILLLIFINMVVTSAGQKLSKKIVYQCLDSTVWNARSIYVKAPNEFLIEKESNGTTVFITGKGVSGLFKKLGGRGSLSNFQALFDTTNRFYKTDMSLLYGPVSGQDLITFKHPLSDNEKFFALPLLMKDSIRIYINGRPAAVVDTFTNDIWNIEFKTAGQLQSKSTSISSGYDKWIALSNNGNAIYSVENRGVYWLYLNGQLKDTSGEEFKNLMINNRGDHIYGSYKLFPSGDSLRYSYAIVKPDTVIKTGGYFNSQYLGSLGEYFLQGKNNKADMILINDQLIKGVDDIDNIRFAGKDNFLFTHTRDSMPYINVNGTSSNTRKYKQVYYPAIDDKGNYAYYGLRNYYLYKVVNGREAVEPISAYGVRAHPLYISSKGESTHLFITDDSTYLYQDDRLLIKPASNHTDSIFISEAHYPFFHRTYGKLDEPREGRGLVLITVNDASYMVFKGEVSRPMKRVENYNYGKEKKMGEIVCSEMSKDGFFLIQKTGPRSFLINMNNTVYHNIEGVDFIFDQYSKFDGQEVVFNGIINQSLYQFNFRK